MNTIIESYMINFLRQMHETRGTNFVFNNAATKFTGDGERVQKILLEDGTELTADVVVVAIGKTIMMLLSKHLLTPKYKH